MAIPQSTPYQLPLFDLDASSVPHEKPCRVCGAVKPLLAFTVAPSNRDGRATICKACDAAQHRAKRALNVDTARAHARAYYAANRDHIRAWARQWHANREQAVKVADLERLHQWAVDHPDRARAGRRRRHERNKEHDNARNRAYGQVHADQLAAYRRAWKQANVEKVRGSWHRRRAWERGADGSWTDADIEALDAAQSGLCAYCQRPDGTQRHIDHRTPLSRGGSNWPSNLALTCARCNLSKSDKTEDEFRIYLDRYGA